MPPRKSAASSIGAADVSNLEGDSTISMATTNATPNTTAKSNGPRGGGGDDGIGVEDLLLPRTLTHRLARGVLPANTSIHRDALLALTKAATVFVSYLSSTASASLPPNKRTVGPQEVFAAVREVEFEGFLGRMERELGRFEEVNRGKRKGYRDRIKGKTGSGGAGGKDDAEEEEGGAADGEDGERGTKRVKRDGEEDGGDGVEGTMPWAPSADAGVAGADVMKSFASGSSTAAVHAGGLTHQHPVPGGNYQHPYPLPQQQQQQQDDSTLLDNEDTLDEEDVDYDEEPIEEGVDQDEDPDEEDEGESEAEAQLRQEMAFEEEENHRTVGEDVEDDEESD